jgi:hypothetical protein
VNIDRETVRKILTEDLDMRKVCAKIVLMMLMLRMILSIVLPDKEKRKQENKVNFSKIITSKCTKQRKQQRKVQTQKI